MAAGIYPEIRYLANCTRCGRLLSFHEKCNCNVIASNWFETRADLAVDVSVEYHKNVEPRKNPIKKRNRNL